MKDNHAVDLSIILVNWNQKELTLNCLASIFSNPPSCRYAVILVDNASTDDTVEAVSGRFPQVTVIENSNNLGLVKANNIAMKRSESEFIVLLNNDTIIKPGCFDNLYGFIRERRDAGMVGARMYYGDGSLQMSCFQFPTILNALYESIGLTSLFSCSRSFGAYEMTWWDHNEVRKVDWVSTACYIARRRVFEEAGYLDETYFVYNDDIDMGFKMKKKGFKVFYLPAAELIHLSGRNVTKISERKIMESAASLRYTMKKNHNVLYYLIWNHIKIFGLIMKSIKWGVKTLVAGRTERDMSKRNLKHFAIYLKYFIMLLRNIHFSTFDGKGSVK
jgi:GT2 family glycosyltransferase